LREGLEKLHRLEAEDLPRVGVGPGKVFNWEWIWKLELLGMVGQAKLYTQAALMRTESRGAHYRSDYPHTDNENWLKNIIVQKVAGEACYHTEPVEFPYLNPATYRAGRG
jgi:succinate dehydrogenase/fumarate reductase flavoprotein subunit